MPPCLLVNPRSFRASRSGLAQRATRLARDAGLDVHEVVDPASLRARLDALRERRMEQIWILAGDGTIHALAEYFAETAPDWSPALLLLAGGRANVVPREFDGYPAMPALRRALAALRAGLPLREEPLFTLQLSQPGGPTRHGFVFAGALIHEAVRLTAESRAAGRGWWRHSWFADPALVATTLDMRKALYNPFAQRGAGPVRFTAISAAAPSLWGMLPRLLKGRFDASMDVAQGILSGRSERVELQGVAGYALDGELFSADPALPLVFTAGVTLRSLRPAP